MWVLQHDELGLGFKQNSKFQYLTEKNISNFVDSIVHTDGVLLLSVRTAPGTVMTNFKYMIYNVYIYIYMGHPL